MHITYTPEQQQLQEELRAYFAQLMTPERATLERVLVLGNHRHGCSVSAARGH